MRDSANFKELVYQKASVKKAEIKKKRKIMASSVAALSVCFAVISVAVLSSGNFANGFVNFDADYGAREAMMYNSAKGAAAFDDGMVEIVECETVAENAVINQSTYQVLLDKLESGHTASLTYSAPEVSDFITEIAKKECRIESIYRNSC